MAYHNNKDVGGNRHSDRVTAMKLESPVDLFDHVDTVRMMHLRNTVRVYAPESYSMIKNKPAT